MGRDDVADAAWLKFGAMLVRRSLEPDEGENEAIDADLESCRSEFITELDGRGTFAVIASNARLDADEAQVLAVLAAAELNPVMHHHVATLQHDASKNRITLGTLMRLFAPFESHRGVLCVGADSALRRAAFVEILPDGPWSDHVIALHPTVVWALAGDLSRDPDMPVVRETRSTERIEGDLLTTITGPDTARRRRLATELTAGSRFVVVAAPTDRAGWSALVREVTLTGPSVVLEVDDDELSEVGRTWIERAHHVAWAISSQRDLPIASLPNRPWTAGVADADPPTDDEWAAAFGSDVERSHRLKAEQLDAASKAFVAFDGNLDAAVRRIVSGRLDGLARRIRPTRSWSDIVLSPDRTDVLRSIVDRYTNSHQVFVDWGFTRTASTGTVALFTGPSGTGKTLATEIVAGELGLDVFKLDLSAVVSKYIGETEKNLEQVFEAATSGNLVLFFDEADALFGKRSEVRDARDRYANIEVSYLLQRLESYDGLVVLATNFEKNIDDAFLRRIHVRLEFNVPGVAERRAIWKHNLPPAAPLGEIDVDWLAKQFELSGALISNAALQAGFIAAAAGTEISTATVVTGIATEYRKVGRLIRPDDFGEYFELVSPIIADR